MTKAGFRQSMHDYTLFIKRINEDIIKVFVYVEDIVITSNKDALINDPKKYLQSTFL